MNAVNLARVSCSAFFLAGLATGWWKYRCIAARPAATAPVYVDICHRAALMYSFACLVLAELASLSAWPANVNLWAVGGPIFFFVLALASYAVHAFLADTDNQLAQPHRLGRHTVNPTAVKGFMVLLAVFEIGGAAVLTAGYLYKLTIDL